MTTKNPSAKSASRERRKERYMTSIVLSSRDRTSVGEETAIRKRNTQQKGTVIAERTGNAKQAKRAQDRETKEC